MIRLAPSILSADFGQLEREVQAVEAGGADWIHVDVMDGHFVPNLTIGPLVVDAVRRATSLPLDVHLMIENPERLLEPFVEAGADRLTVHQETCPHLHRVVERIRELGAAPGVALNPATPLNAVEEILPRVDLLLLMTVNPGFGGQTFIEQVLGKVERARRMAADPSLHVQVDGGIDSATAPRVAAAGADVLVAGSAVFGHARGPEEGARELRAAVSEGG